MTNKAYGKRQKNDFIKRHDITNLLPELDKALQFDIVQLLNRNSSEVNRTLRIAALRNENESLTDLGVSVRAYLLAAIDGVEWANGRLALKKGDVKQKTEIAFTVYIEKAKQDAAKKAKQDAEKAEKEKAEKDAAKAKQAAEKAAAAVAAAEKAKAEKDNEAAQIAAANAAFEAKKAESQLVAADRNIGIKAAQNLLHGIIAGNLKTKDLQEINDTIHLLGLARQALARQAMVVPNKDADENRVQELAKIKATSKEKSAGKAA